MGFTGFTADTAKHLQLDAGAFFKNYDLTKSYAQNVAQGALIGATAGGGSFAAIPTIRRIEVDGVKGAAKGMEALDEWEVTLTANVKEITADVIKMALATGASTASTSPSSGYTKITATDEIQASHYFTNVTWVGRLSGSSDPVVIVVKNALATNGLTLTTQDKAEGVIALTIVGHYDTSALSVPPFEIYYPGVSTT